jgi:hypothetical protein
MHSLELSALNVRAGREAALDIINNDLLITEGQKRAFLRLLENPSHMASTESPSLEGFHAGDLFIDVMARAPEAFFDIYEEMNLSARRFSSYKSIPMSRTMPPLNPQGRLKLPSATAALAGYEYLATDRPTLSGDLVVLEEGDEMVPRAVRLMSEAGNGEPARTVVRRALFDPLNGFLVMESARGFASDAKQRLTAAVEEAFDEDVPRMVPITFHRREGDDGSFVVEAILPMNRPFFGRFEKYAYDVRIMPDRIITRLDAVPAPDAWPVLFEYSDDFRKMGIHPTAKPLVRFEATIAEQKAGFGAWDMIQLAGANRRQYTETTLFVEGAHKLFKIGAMPRRRGAAPLGGEDFPVGSRKSFFVAGPKAREFSLSLWHFLEGREYDPADYGIEAEFGRSKGSTGIRGIVKAGPKREPTGGGGGGGPVCSCHDFDPVWEMDMMSTAGFAALIARPPVLR